MSIELKIEMLLDSKRSSIPRLIFVVIAGFTVFSYVSYIAYEFSRSVMNSYSKDSLVVMTRSAYQNLDHEHNKNPGGHSKTQTSQSNHGNNTQISVKPCSRNSGPCKDIPDYFKGMFHNIKKNIFCELPKSFIRIKLRK